MFFSDQGFALSIIVSDPTNYPKHDLPLPLYTSTPPITARNLSSAATTWVCLQVPNIQQNPPILPPMSIQVAFICSCWHLIPSARLPRPKSTSCCHDPKSCLVSCPASGQVGRRTWFYRVDMERGVMRAFLEADIGCPNMSICKCDLECD